MNSRLNPSEPTTGTWTNEFLEVDCSGERHEFWTSPTDGACSHAVIDSAEPGVVHDYGYAGDG